MEEWKRARGIMDEWAIRRDKERKKVEKKMQQMKHTNRKREIMDGWMNEREIKWMEQWKRARGIMDELMRERNTDRIE